jgi:hypothetical protein
MNEKKIFFFFYRVSVRALLFASEQHIYLKKMKMQ